MKRGLRKLCDVIGPPSAPEREQVVTPLLNAGIRFECHKMRRRGAAGLRFYVASADLARAIDLLPLNLRGFRAAGAALFQGKHA